MGRGPAQGCCRCCRPGVCVPWAERNFESLMPSRGWGVAVGSWTCLLSPHLFCPQFLCLACVAGCRWEELFPRVRARAIRRVRQSPVRGANSASVKVTASGPRRRKSQEARPGDAVHALGGLLTDLAGVASARLESLIQALQQHSAVSACMTTVLAGSKGR